MMVKKANIELYKLEAKFYEKVHFEIFCEGEQKYIDETLYRLWHQLESKQICLDMGCGTGNITRRAQKYFTQVIGLDLSFNMLLHLKERTKAQNIFLICGDCENLPFKEITFDFISMYSILHHLPHPYTSLKELFQALKIGGMLYIANEPNEAKYRLCLHPIRNMFSLLGQLLTNKKFKYPHLTSCQNQLGPLTDIHVQKGFSQQDIKKSLRSLGFSNVTVAFHDFFQFIFAALPRPLNQLVKLDRLLEKNKILTRLGNTLVITAIKLDE